MPGTTHWMTPTDPSPLCRTTRSLAVATEPNVTWLNVLLNRASPSQFLVTTTPFAFAFAFAFAETTEIPVNLQKLTPDPQG